jgi:hypothetical protein
MAIKINLGDAELKKIIVSFLFVIFGILFLIINELSYVSQVKNYHALGGKAIEVNPDQINNSNNNKLVYIFGSLSAEKKVSDSVFAVEVDGLRLKRKSEIYQWKENKADNQPATYELVWSENLINSKNFTDTEKVNPTTPSFPSDEFVNEQPKIGAFNLDKKYLYRLGGYESVNLNTLFPKASDIVIDNLYECICINNTICPNYDKVKAQAKDLKTQISKVYTDKSKYSVKDWRCKKLPNEIISSVVNLKNGFKLEENYAFKGFDYSKPKVGDIRISYEYIPYGQYSVMGKQQGDLITSFATKGALIESLFPGKVATNTMYKEPKKRSFILQIMFRVFSFALIFIGFRNLLLSKEHFSKINPKLDLVKKYIQNPLLITVSIIFLLIGIIWFLYNIFIGILSLVIAGAIFFYINKTNNSQDSVSGSASNVNIGGKVSFIQKIKQALAKNKGFAKPNYSKVNEVGIKKDEQNVAQSIAQSTTNANIKVSAPSSPVANIVQAKTDDVAVKKVENAAAAVGQGVHSTNTPVQKPVVSNDVNKAVQSLQQPVKPEISNTATSAQGKVQENKVMQKPAVQTQKQSENKPVQQSQPQPQPQQVKAEVKKPEEKPKLQSEVKVASTSVKAQEKQKEPVKQSDAKKPEVKQEVKTEAKPEIIKAKEPSKLEATKQEPIEQVEEKKAIIVDESKEPKIISDEDRAKFFEQFKKK